MEEESLEEKSWRRNHGGIIGGGIMDVELWRSNEDQTWRRHLGSIWKSSGKHLGNIWDAFGKHFEFILDAFGRHLEGWRLRRHLGSIWRSDLTKVQHLSAIMQQFLQNVGFTNCF